MHSKQAVLLVVLRVFSGARCGHPAWSLDVKNRESSIKHLRDHLGRGSPWVASWVEVEGRSQMEPCFRSPIFPSCRLCGFFCPCWVLQFFHLWQTLSGAESRITVLKLNPGAAATVGPEARRVYLTGSLSINRTEK